MDMDDKDLARMLGLARIGLGVAAFLLPKTVTKAWAGSENEQSALFMRGLAGRDIGLGVGLLTALETGAPVRGWLEAGAVSDVADAVGIVTNWKRIPGFRALLALATSGGAAFLGLQLADSLDEE